MTDIRISFLRKLETMLGNRDKDVFYLCISDLLEHGLDTTRFSDGEIKPNLQDITQYLAAWSRHAGFNEVESSDWLIDYCINMISSLSKRTPAAIKHSTKSNIRYIYRSAVPFLCQCADNRFRAHCTSDCPVYADMQTSLKEKAHELLNPRPVLRTNTTILAPPVSLKAGYQEQFDAGMRIALEEAQKGTNLLNIVNILNERGFKTRTGRKWQCGNMRNELQKINNIINPKG